MEGHQHQQQQQQQQQGTSSSSSSSSSRWRTSLSGAWMLDVSRSDTMRGFLECQQIPAPAIDIQVMGEQTCGSLNVISIDGTALTMYKRTRINDFKETFELDEVKVTTTRHGTRRCVVSLGGGAAGGREGEDRAVFSSTAPTPSGEFHVVETRRLLDGGRSHAQEIRIQNFATGGTDLTVRMWTRVPMTPEYRAALK